MDHAFQLAEKYRDFRSLASLCNKDAVYPLEANPHANSIHAYIEKFRDEFTEELYHWYIEHGTLSDFSVLFGCFHARLVQASSVP